MKTITQQSELAYHAISFQDAITLLPLMDELAERFAGAYKDLKGTAEDSYRYNKVKATYIALGNQISLLLGLGFCPSSADSIQFDPQYFPIRSGNEEA